MKLQHYLLCLIVTFFACRKENPPVVLNPALVDNHIRFDSLAVGQTSKYLVLSGENYSVASDMPPTFEYSDDTVQLKIVGKDNLGYKVEEKMIYNGEVYLFLDQIKDSVWYYYIQVVNDTLRVKPIQGTHLQSRILQNYSSTPKLALNGFSEPLVQIYSWRTDMEDCSCLRTGYTAKYTLFGNEYDRLNVIMDNRSMSTDGPGLTWIYSKRFGIVRYSTYDAWSNSGYGLDLL